MFLLVQRAVLLLELFIAAKVCGAFGPSDNKRVCVPTANINRGANSQLVYC